MLAHLRSLDPRLPRSVSTLQAGELVSAIGNGLVLPFAATAIRRTQAPIHVCGDWESII